MTVITTILTKGPEYDAPQAQWFHSQLQGLDAVCLTDLVVPGVTTMPLTEKYPGWWAKLELFNPDGPLGKEDLFYIDLDTLIVEDLSPLMQQTEMTMLTNFYSMEENDPIAASGLMFIPAKVKAAIWEQWMTMGPEVAMKKFVVQPAVGDQGFLNHAQPEILQRWQDVAPGEVISYKKDVACRGMPGYHDRRSKGNGKIPKGTRVVCFHGQPRPWLFDWRQISLMKTP